MPFGFNYPAPGGTGAVSGGNLDTACGTYDVPSSGDHTIKGFVYPAGTAPDPFPPAGATAGFCDGFGNWHFSGASPPLLGGGGLVVGTPYTLNVWETHPILGGTPGHPCAFTACASGSAGCVPNCPPPGPAPQPFDRDLEPVIVHIASRFFRVFPAPAIVDLWTVFDYPLVRADRQFILLTYDDVGSNFERAIWLSPVQQGTRLRLEVKRGPYCHQALMVRVRVGGNTIASLERWEASCFDIVHGGSFVAITPDCFPREGSVILKPGRSDSDLVDLGPAPSLPESLTLVPEIPAPPAPRPARRRGRGYK
ncbi:MAG: hypothetical protein L0211_02620 [Planctomycetaceae bacterium]|nr:hypothetical protein [Planctomycetaceae bacterium]